MSNKIKKREKKEPTVPLPTTTVRPITDNLKAQIKELAPRLQWSMIAMAADIYNLTPDLGRSKRALRENFEPSIPVRDQMVAVSDQALELWTTLSSLDLRGRAAIWDAALPHGGAAFVTSAEAMLLHISQFAKTAYNASEVSEGRPRSSRQKFVESLSNSLAFANYPVNHKQSGLLFKISKLLLDHFDDCPDDLSKMLKSVLGEN